MSFSKFHFHAKIVAGLKSCNYVKPTPIQSQAIPAVLRGADLLGLAQTGTGKTAAFVLPILQKLMNGPRGKARCLIVAPTRELAEQIHESIEKMAARTGLRSVSIYGGVSKFNQIKKVRRGVDIIVACPGRLLDHLNDRAINLSKIECLVLDEADHMFDMGFLPAIKSLLKYLPKQRQNLLFSATMAKEIRTLAHDILSDPVTIQIDYEQPTNRVSHVAFTVAQEAKTSLLKKLIDGKDVETALIFTRTKHKAKSLGNVLLKAGYKATSIQGNLSQAQRQRALNGFRQGQFNILVATDIAARGIDVAGISHVINYDMPDTLDAYTHRIGRTGRADATGRAYNFVSGKDRQMITMIERVLGKKMERSSLEVGKISTPRPRSLSPKEGGDFYKKKNARPTRSKKRSYGRSKNAPKNSTTLYL